MKKIIVMALALVLMVACQGQDQAQDQGQEQGQEQEENQKLEKYERSFFDSFDTIIVYTAYAESQEAFDEDADFVEAEFARLHKIYDNYNTYEGINNIKTANDMAGQGPVEVDKELVDLLLLSKEGYEEISPKVNIAMGSVLDIWHDYREEGFENPDSAQLPDEDELQEAAGHMDMGDIIIDEEKLTVEIKDPDLSINLGATAKGYATELICDALEERGVDSAIVSAGGNVKTIGRPKDGRDKWGIGIQNPENVMGRSEERMAASLFVEGTSVVTSGNYQRYYMVDGKLYHHIIDPDSLYPANYYSSVSVVHEDSGLADYLSTAAFLLPEEESRQLIEDNGAEALWIGLDSSISYTPGLEEVLGDS